MSNLPSTTATKPIETPTKWFPGSGVSVRGRSFLVAGLLLLAVATTLRSYHLGNRSLWYDEAMTANASRGTFAQVLQVTRRFSAPVIHPYILYLVEKVGQTSAAVRAPSALASLLAVLVMLAMVRVKISRKAALFAAAILAVSASQIRYAQEVREYSLAVLVAAILIFSLLKWETSGSRSDHPVLLYVALFIVPLVQYGLVFFSFAILTTILGRLLLTRGSPLSWSRAGIASACFVAGGLLSFYLTVRYQFHAGGTQWYLAGNYFDPKMIGLLPFLGTNTRALLSFLMPGHLLGLCFVVGTLISFILQAIDRKWNTITLLLISSVLVTMCASVVRLYPYGGIRQCLFLAPVLALFAGVSFADILDRIKGTAQLVAAICLMAVIVVSLFRGTLHEWPYREVEDTQSILKELARSSAQDDQVWVNHDAVAAFEFYQHEKDPRFIYGKYHADARDYLPDLSKSIDPHTTRLWLVFSHLSQSSDRTEAQLILNSLSSEWNVLRVLAPTNTALYVANRKIVVMNDGGAHTVTSPPSK